MKSPEKTKPKAVIMLVFVLAGCQTFQAPPAAPVTQVLPTPESLPTWSMLPTLSMQLPLQVARTVDLPYTSQELLDVYSPVADGDWPVVIVFHGGGDYKGMVSELAQAIAEQGAVVFAPTYHSRAPTTENPVGTGAEDAACAVRFARDQAATYGSRDDRMIVVGHSIGALMGTLMMLAGDDFNGDCLTKEGSALPDAFVGLDGGYDPIPFMPDELLESAPADCLRIDPYTYIDRKPIREDVSFLLFVGSYLTSQKESQAFRDALQDSGYEVFLVQIPGIDHNDMARPQPQTINAIAGLLHP